jgi:hypothetical protein
VPAAWHRRSILLASARVARQTRAELRLYITAMTDQFWKSTAAPSNHPHLSGEQLNEEVKHLEHRVDKLTLICQAMWELLSHKHGIDEQTLVGKVAEIDLRDGELNDSTTKGVVTCPKCGHAVNSRHLRCIYCGFHDFGRNKAFDGV